MLKNQRKIIQNKKLKGKAGGNTNESCFGGWEKELREHKLLTIASERDGNRMELEQGWNKLAKDRDIIKLVAIDENDHKIEIIIEREELEQAMAYFAQGDELLKYSNSKIK